VLAPIALAWQAGFVIFPVPCDRPLASRSGGPALGNNQEPGKDRLNEAQITPFPWPSEAPVGHAAIALGAVEAPLEAVAGLRRRLGLPGQPPFPATLLKASEDQTVIALAAVLRALETAGLPCETFRDWGVLAAPRSLGRLAAAESLAKFQQGGAWRVSPFVVPHHSLHSVSGTVSQALQTYGPNFGIGGNSGAVVEGLLSALTLLEEDQAPGLWLLLSEYEPEPIPDEAGACLVPVVCRALALAFRPAAADQGLLWLRLVKDRAETASMAAGQPPTVAELIRFLAGEGDGQVWTRSLPWGAHLQMIRSVAAAEALARAPMRHVA
jgi:hypothetical protein